MRIPKTPVGILLLLCCLTLSRISAAQSETFSPPEPQAALADQLIFQGMQMGQTAFDCSHFVNYLFDKAGLEYDYQPSSALYRGTEEFKRVSQPATGDLIVWPGHVGIVVDPDAKTFLSALRSGVRVASYTSPYWKRRGRARFFRYNLFRNRTPFQVGTSSAQDLNDSAMD